METFTSDKAPCRLLLLRAVIALSVTAELKPAVSPSPTAGQFTTSWRKTGNSYFRYSVI